MGCETSKQENQDIVSIGTQEQFKLSYRELVSQDRGHVFQLYHFATIINRSNYSIVRNVISRASQQSRICKIVPLMNKKYFTIVSQVEFLKRLDHPNIIQIFEYFLEPSFLYMILEQVPGQRILRELNKIKQGVIFQDVVQIMKQLLRAVQFCHSKLIAHRSITTQNILLFYNQTQPFIKIIDFSQACTIGCPNPTPVSPEKRNLFLNQRQLNQTDKIDIYDCGVVIYSLIKGKKVRIPNLYVNYQQMIKSAEQAVKQTKLNSKVQKDLIDLLTCMLAKDPQNRPTAIECLNHPFFQNFNKGISSKKALTHLMKFQPENNLKYLLSMYASLNMTSAIEKAQYLSQFYNLDKNKDGQIQLQQLIQGLKNTFNFSKQQAKQYAQKMFNNLDKNKSGAINFSEYITGTVQLSKLISNDFLQKMFNQIDMNRDGLITNNEVNNLILGIDRYNVLEGHKEVNFKQFKEIMVRILQNQNVKTSQ